MLPICYSILLFEYKKTIIMLSVLNESILTRMLVSVSKSHRKGLENYGKDIKT
ncbi:hypothetical protein [Helicobacter pylori]|uniref:hypothetical protein n=1 Tax=Helicobacter pylori TaxID=210 RepID=UPI0015E7ADE4|nr:hypothetical protein [Helicobacter pylori]